MIAVAILAIIAAVAIPAYNGYIRESRLGAMRMNLDTLRIAVEAFKLDDTSSRYRPAAGGPSYYFNVSGSTTIKAAYGWAPEGDNDAYGYTVYLPTSTIYALQAISLKTGNVPWAACDKDPAKSPVFKCCDGITGSPPSSGCPRP
jgi:Tfp pilus assembly protein PilE